MPWFLKAARTGAGQRQAGGSGGMVPGEAVGCHHQQGMLSCLSRQTWRTFKPAPCDVALPAAGFTRYLGFALQRWCSLYRALPAKWCDCQLGWFGDGKRALSPKWSCCDYSRQSSFEPWKTCRVLQPSKPAQARLVICMYQ